MQLNLSCYCCGGIDFKHILVSELKKVEEEYYLPTDKINRTKVKCVKCGLEDYIPNLSLKLSDCKEDIV